MIDVSAACVDNLPDVWELRKVVLVVIHELSVQNYFGEMFAVVPA